MTLLIPREIKSLSVKIHEIVVYLFLYFIQLFHTWQSDSGYQYTLNTLCYNPLYYQITNVYNCVYQHIT